MAGHWTTPDLFALLELFVRNREALESVVYGHWWGALLYRVRHLLNRNTRQGSRKNIHAHYDLGNAFYKLWLDESMNYSSAWFDGDAKRSLPAAQDAKMRRALQECAVQPGPRVLEIGCGWGASGRAGSARVRCAADRRHAVQRTARLGPAAAARTPAWPDAGRAALPGLPRHRAMNRFDAIVSIEMFEAVGREYWDGYFKTVHDKLKPGGRACIQSITIRDDLFERYTRSTDFIQQYIFPGGLLPSPSQFRAHAEKAGLRVVERTGLRRSTMPRPCTAGARPSCATKAPCASWASTPASCGCGSSTWPIARPPSRPATPT